jgi:hypothetical protein
LITKVIAGAETDGATASVIMNLVAVPTAPPTATVSR